MNKEEIDAEYPKHTYNSCNDDDERCNNSGFNRCPRCTELELLRLRDLKNALTKIVNTSPNEYHHREYDTRLRPCPTCEDLVDIAKSALHGA